MDVRTDYSGRIQSIRYGNMAEPGTCLLCGRIGRTADELFANLQTELEYYGIAYLCTDCCAEAADFILYKSPEKYEELKRKYEALQRDWNALRSQLAEAKGLLDARINSAGSSEPNGNGTAGVHVSSSESEPDDIDRILNDNEPVSA